MVLAEMRSLVWLRFVIVEGIHNTGFLSISVVLILFLDGLHEFIQLTDLLI
jgi:hypothetical protein